MRSKKLIDQFASGLKAEDWTQSRIAIVNGNTIQVYDIFINRYTDLYTKHFPYKVDTKTKYSPKRLG